MSTTLGIPRPNWALVREVSEVWSRSASSFVTQRTGSGAIHPTDRTCDISRLEKFGSWMLVSLHTQFKPQSISEILIPQKQCPTIFARLWGKPLRETWTFLRYTKKCSETKNVHFQKSATIAQKVLMFKQPDPQAFLQHTLTQSHYAWDHATWTLHNQHHSPLLQVSHQIHLDGPN